jgi:hypothetical protein
MFSMTSHKQLSADDKYKFLKIYTKIFNNFGNDYC